VNPYQISIANRQKAVRIDRRAITSLARLTLKIEQVVAAEISVAFVNDAEIHEINRRFLNHDFPTDVISFLLDASPEVETANAPGTVRRGAGRTIDGEIVISTDTAASNAAKLRTTTEHELKLYLVHGLLHMCGYDDLTPSEKRLMRRREAEVLSSAGPRR
jgi:probable rRNA maturation factor